MEVMVMGEMEVTNKPTMAMEVEVVQLVQITQPKVLLNARQH